MTLAVYKLYLNKPDLKNYMRLGLYLCIYINTVSFLQYNILGNCHKAGWHKAAETHLTLPYILVHSAEFGEKLPLSDPLQPSTRDAPPHPWA